MTLGIFFYLLLVVLFIYFFISTLISDVRFLYSHCKVCYREGFSVGLVHYTDKPGKYCPRCMYLFRGGSKYDSRTRTKRIRTK
jgi:hypothetical protein